MPAGPNPIQFTVSVHSVPQDRVEVAVTATRGSVTSAATARRIAVDAAVDDASAERAAITAATEAAVRSAVGRLLATELALARVVED